MLKNLLSIKNKLSSKRGFSLVELIVAIAVLMIAMSMIAPAFYANATAEGKVNNLRKQREDAVGGADTIFTKAVKPTGSGAKDYTVTFKSGVVQVSGNTYEVTKDGYTFGVVVAG